MKTVDYPCEHGYYGLCTQCVREERNELRARVAELEARIAELQPMAQCAAIMAVCGYFSRMRGPDAWLDHGSWDEYPELFACAGVDLRSFQHGTRFYAGSAPVPAAQANDVVLLPAEATDAMQDNMREALIDQGWDSDSAGEVDFADLWHAGVYEYQERTADMLAAKAKGG